MASVALQLDAAATARAAVDAYVAANQKKSLLRLLTCGSVDDGKSTLIGRLLYDSKLLFEDQLAALTAAGPGNADGGGIDFASLVDGLAAEREQGITIDVAYRFFATDKRKFIIADTPGHEQYTRNMATGASTADLAILLIDARKGVLPQTKRHSTIAHLLGIRHLVLAVNKMDLVGFAQTRFDEIVADYRAFAQAAGIAEFTAIPMSAQLGDNIAAPGSDMAWYSGPTLLAHLENVPVAAQQAGLEPFRMGVQWVNRHGQDFRGYAGTIASGRVRVGDAVSIAPSGRQSRIASIITYSGALDEAAAGQAVTLTLADEVDCSRGDVIASAGALNAAASFEAHLVWMAEARLVPHRSYWLKLGTQLVSASISRVGDRFAVNGARPDGPLGLNDIATVEIDLDRRVAATAYSRSRSLGGFILIDKVSNATVAAGMIVGFPASPAPLERRDEGIFHVAGASADERQAAARRLEARLRDAGRASFVLSEDVLREGLGASLAHDDRDGLARLAGEAARLLQRAGMTVIVSVAPGETVPLPGVEAPEDGAADWVI